MKSAQEQMLFQTPGLSAREQDVVGQIDEMKATLRSRLYEPRRWFGSLRRISMARAIQGSNSIEGFTAKLDDAAAVERGEAPLDANEETRLALEGYQHAMTYVLQLAADDHFIYSDHLLKGLHFMMTSYDLDKSPGRWRPGPVFVTKDETGEQVYEGPDAELVPSLVEELIAELNNESDLPAVIRAAMAHLNLVMIHPFRDGNGRMSRCLQTLVLSREGDRVLHPAFCSIEEYLGQNTETYYSVLAGVGAGRWQPSRDARPWIHYILTAHLRQARTMLDRVQEIEVMWNELETLTKKLGLPERMIFALADATMGFRVRKSTYQAVDRENIPDHMASRDLGILVKARLLKPHGEKRGRYYVAGAPIEAIQQQLMDARRKRPKIDPFADAA